MKKFFNWLLTYDKSFDISSLITVIVALSFINLFDYKPIRNNLFLLIPFLIIVSIAMKICEWILRSIFRKLNFKISKSYFYVAIF
ncbi:hypothetical protein BIV60_20290 [Bacillus sp. MUM 116]|nr:hypothetical protein BIV60_20290 [Bacillus sp. MUM 116]